MKARLQRIEPGRRRLADFEALVGREALERVREQAAALKGCRLLYLAAAPGESGDPTASVVPLLRDLGIEAERAMLHGDADFAEAARGLVDGLRGAEWEPAAGDWDDFREACEAAAVAFDLRGYDFVLASGPASAPMIEGRRSDRARWIWRTWSDLSRPHARAREEFLPALDDYAALVFAEDGFAPHGLDPERLRVVPGAFDPLAPAHRVRGAETMAEEVRDGGVDPSRPLLCLVARLDGWVDPLAAIESWRLARGRVRGLQLAICGRIDASDPEAIGIVAEIEAFAGAEPDLLLLTDRHGAGQCRLGAVQQLARCQLHCPLAEGFEPALAAAMWKGTPVVRAASHEDRAEAIASLCLEPGRAVRLGLRARERARAGLLLPRLLGDELRLFSATAAEASGDATRAAA